MRTAIWRYLVSAVSAILLFGCSEESSAPVVTIETGQLRGTVDQGVLAFKGIPYAAAPIDALRWRPPEPPESWDGVRPAEEYGFTCAQLNNPTLWFDLPPISEDCLTLNVWTPDIDPVAPLPVMVSIHGGGFVQGSGTNQRQNGADLAREGVVLVSINYRLAMFGFMTHPALAQRNKDAAQGNYGLLDARAALQWVQKNISRFGGDPDNVTIFGTSAGGDAVNLLMVMPGTEGLFHKAIAQSASTGLAPAPYLDRVSGFLPPAFKSGENFVGRLEIPETADMADALYDLTMEELLGAMTVMDRFGYVVDGEIIPDQVGLLFARGQHRQVPYILGTNSFEAALGYQVGGDNFSPEMFARLVPAADKERLYPGLAEKEVKEQIFSDIVMSSGLRNIANHQIKTGQPVYGYYLSYVADARRGKQPGAAHADDVAFVMRNLDAEKDLDASNISGRDVEVSRLMSSYWLQFAKTGNPNGEGLPYWPPYDPDMSAFLEIGDEVAIRERFLKQRAEFHMERAAALLDRITNR